MAQIYKILQYRKLVGRQLQKKKSRDLTAQKTILLHLISTLDFSYGHYYQTKTPLWLFTRFTSF